MATINDQAVLQTIFHPNVPFDEDWQEKQQPIQGDDSLSGGGRGEMVFHKLQRLLSLQALRSKEMPPISAHNRFLNLFLTNHFQIRHLKGTVGWRVFAHRSPKRIGRRWLAGCFQALATFVHASKKQQGYKAQCLTIASFTLKGNPSFKRQVTVRRVGEGLAVTTASSKAEVSGVAWDPSSLE